MADDFLTGHMATHIVAMNLLAPLLVLATGHLVRNAGGIFALATATFVQMALLWGWHMPAALAAAMHHPPLMAAMHLSLFAAAFWFWLGVIGSARRGELRPLVALLVTGKLFCLLGVLLLLAPRLIYGGHGHSGVALLADQQRAGLLMLAACPPTYIAAAFIAARLWLARARLSVDSGASA